MSTNRDKHRIAALVGDISFYAALVNLHTDYAVFVDMSGHVETLEVSVRQSKERYTNVLTKDNIRLSGLYVESQHVIDALTSIKMNLKKILNDGNIPYNYLNYTIRRERDYHLAGGWRP